MAQFYLRIMSAGRQWTVSIYVFSQSMNHHMTVLVKRKTVTKREKRNLKMSLLDYDSVLWLIYNKRTNLSAKSIFLWLNDIINYDEENFNIAKELTNQFNDAS
jgi:hypothetical protein